ncbi:MAG: CBS domain-containing protein, partial [Candidatus Altiarchaeota archaeon]|nr:CBS domain-containing protein [Candidatus Altiarchaeota archaeon]
KKIVAVGYDPKVTTISQIMSECAYTIDSGKDVYAASEMFNEHDIRRLPVVEEGKIIGIITTRDVAKSLAYLSARKVQEYGRRTFGRPPR